MLQTGPLHISGMVMKTLLLSALLASVALHTGFGSAQHQDNKNGSAFVGRWDLTLHSETREYPSWLQISGSGDEMQGRMVGRWGHAHPVVNLRVAGDSLSFESPKSQEGLPVNMSFKTSTAGGELKGTVTGPPDGPWTITGSRAPSLTSRVLPHWGSPKTLFDGHDFAGWTFSKPDAASNWTAKDGILKSSFKGSELITTDKFRDFKLHVEFNCEANCNSGVYLRGRYEVQIADAAGSVSPDRRAGAVYGFIAPDPEVQITPGTWQTYDITFVGRTVTVAWNGKTVIDHQEIPGITGGALDSDEGSPGPIYLQGSERAGGTSFRNIVITPALQ